jgi:transcriptional regulator NrdR family protein
MKQTELHPGQEISELKAQAFELESELTQMMARARVIFMKVEDVVSQAEAEIRKREFKVYTEKEAAAIFQVGEQTIARLRKRGKVSCIRFGALTRYTQDHLQGIADALEKKARANKRSL